MRLFSKGILSFALLTVAGTSNAALINFEAAYGLTAANTAAANFASSTYAGVTETFDGADFSSIQANPNTLALLGASSTGNQQARWVEAATSFGTKVGTFTMSAPNTASNGNVKDDYLMIENSDTGEFGRSGGGNWLDSNDADQMTWYLGTTGGSYNAFGFFISDANDQGATLRLDFGDGNVVLKDLTLKGPATGDGRQPDGNIAYISLFSDQSFLNAQVIFQNGIGNADGFGMDDITLAKVPEPGTLALLGLGLAGLSMARRRQS